MKDVVMLYQCPCCGRYLTEKELKCVACGWEDK